MSTMICAMADKRTAPDCEQSISSHSWSSESSQFIIDTNQDRSQYARRPQLSECAAKSIAPYPIVCVHVRSPSSSCASGGPTLGNEGTLSNLRTKDFKRVWLSFTANIRYIPVDDAGKKPRTLVDFRDAFCLVLPRLSEDATWIDVYNHVRIEEYDGLTTLVVQGEQSSRFNLISSRKELLILGTEGEHLDCEWLLNMVYIRIAPWKLLFAGTMTTSQISTNNSEVIDLQNQLVSLSKQAELNTLVWDIPEIPESARVKKAPVPSRAEAFVDIAKAPSDVLKAVMDFVGTGTTIARKMLNLVGSSNGTSASDAASMLQLVADATKAITIVSATFQLMSSFVEVYVLVQESKRGEDTYPQLLGLLTRLHRELARNIQILFQPSVHLGKLQRENVQNVLEQTMDAMAKAEHELMRGKVMKVLKGKELKRVEAIVSNLVQHNLLISLQAELEIVKKQVQAGAGQQYTSLVAEAAPPEILFKRPALCDFFSGRRSELEDIFEKLKLHSKVLLTQYGGSGKTQLMVLMGMEAERRNLAPGGVFWIPAYGGMVGLRESVTRFVEAVKGRGLKAEEKFTDDILLIQLGIQLRKFRERFIVCLDSADHPEIHSYLAEISRAIISNGGWLVLTSRQDENSLISVIRSEQVVRINPLPVEMALVVLWRWKTGIQWDQASDEKMLSDLETKPEEFSALNRIMTTLCLNGLALALQNVGSYMASNEFSVVEYSELVEGKGSQADIKSFLDPDLGCSAFRDEQQGIWSTWNSSFEMLSANAQSISYVMALFGGNEIPESLLRRVAQRLAIEEEDFNDRFITAVRKELVFMTSLVQLHHEGEGTVFEMHPLIRQYVLSDLSKKESLLRQVFQISIAALHESIQSAMDTNDTNVSVKDPVKPLSKEVRLLSKHAANIVHRSWRIQGDIQNLPIRKGMVRSVFGCLPYPRFKTRLNGIDQKFDDIHFFAMRAHGLQNRWRDGLKIGQSLIARYDRRDPSKVNLFEKSGALKTIGRLHCCEGSLREADRVLTKALALIRSLYRIGKGKVNVCDALHELATVKELRGFHRVAHEMYQESVIILHRLFGRRCDHPGLVLAMSRQTVILWRQSSFLQGKQMLEKCIEMQLRLTNGRKDNIALSNTLNDIAALMKDLGDLSVAKEYVEESLAMKRRIFGKASDHELSIAISLRTLADILMKEKSFTAAEKTLHECVTIMERIFGKSSTSPFLKGARLDFARLKIEIELCYANDDSDSSIVYNV